MQRLPSIGASSPARPGSFDAARLQRLLDLVGPDQAPGLLTQLRLDLSDCNTNIAKAAAHSDWDALRDASHVLISLSGSAGAMKLHGLAQGLNAAAHTQDQAALTTILPPLTADLAAVIGLVAAIPGGTPR